MKKVMLTTVNVQRHIWGPWWKTLAWNRTPYTSSGWATTAAFAVCVNGTHTYRIVSDADVIDLYRRKHRHSVRSENELRTNCP